MDEIRNENSDLDLIGVVRSVWNRRKLVLIVASVFTFLSVAIALVAPTEYSVTATMVPQSSQSGGLNSKIRGLAFLAGFSLGNTNKQSEISPVLYPEIVRSVPFMKELSKSLVYSEESGTEVPLKDYLEDHPRRNLKGMITTYTTGLPGTIMKIFQRRDTTLRRVGGIDSVLNLPTVDGVFLGSNSVRLNADPVNGTIKLTVTMNEAVVATQVGLRTQELLQEKIIEFKTQQSKEQLEFTQMLYDEKKMKFESIQDELAKFNDENRVISTSFARNQLARLESQYDIAFQVFSELSSQLETKKIEVRDNASAFTIIHPIMFPNRPSGPNRPRIIFAGVMIGFFFGIASVFVRSTYIYVKAKL